MIEKKTVGKMGLKGVRGLNIGQTQARDGGGRGHAPAAGSRGGGVRKSTRRRSDARA